MPRIQTTGTVRFALILLRIYLVLMLVLVLVYFFRNGASPLSLTHSVPAASTAPATPGTATTLPADPGAGKV